MILNYKGTNVFYTVNGKGNAIVLLHGFLENSNMWHAFIPELSKNNRVISIDLLGHGNTQCLGYAHTMEDQAKMVYAVLKHLKLRKYKVIGHSMGGYVALAFAKLYSKNIKGICLLNSTFTTDDLERKQLRKRANKMALTNYANLVSMSVTNLFSERSRDIYKAEISKVLKEALNTPVQGYIAGNEGMIMREDLETFFTKASFYKTILLGEKDWIVDAKKMQQYATKNQIEVQVFSEGHMSHIENKNELLEALLKFVKKG
ncbi:MAG: alpha/beta fold hydrolase [Oceanihabitans sp.]